MKNTNKNKIELELTKEREEIFAQAMEKAEKIRKSKKKYSKKEVKRIWRDIKTFPRWVKKGN